MARTPSRPRQRESGGSSQSSNESGRGGVPERDGDRDRGRNGDYDGERHRHRHHEKRESPGERQIFMDMVQRRLGGGAPPSAAAYANAMQQWQQLPGAVVFVATPAIPLDDSQTPSPDPNATTPPAPGTREDEGRGP